MRMKTYTKRLLYYIYIKFFYFVEGHVDHRPDRKNGKKDLRVVVVVHVHEARVLHPGLDVRVPNPSLDHLSPSIPWTRPRIKIGRGAAKTKRTTVRGAIVIERDPRRKVEAKRNLVKRSDLATSRSPNNRMTRVDRRTTTARRKR